MKDTLIETFSKHRNIPGYTEQEKTDLQEFFINDIQRIETRLKNLESSTDEFNANPSQEEHRREKRALWRGGSEIMKYLYGTPSANDTDYYNRKFHELSINQETQEKLNKRNFKIVHNLLDIVEKSQVKVNANFHSLMQISQKAFQGVLIHETITDTLHQFTSLSDTVYSEIDLLQNAILFAKHNVLHPSIVNIKKFWNTLKSIPLKSNRKWISDIFSDQITIILSHCHIETIHRSRHVLFIIRLPVIESTYYSLFKCFPLPTLLQNKTYFYIKPHQPYFLTDLSHTIYGYLPNLDKCTFLVNQKILCEVDIFYKKTAVSCEFSLLLGNSQECDFHFSTFITSVWHRLLPNQWLYILDSPGVLTVHLTDDGQSRLVSYPLPSVGVVSLPLGSVGRTSQCILHAGRVNSTFLKLELTIPEVPILELQVPIVLSGYQFPTLTQLDIQEIQRTWDQLLMAQAESHFSHNISDVVTKMQNESTSSFSLSHGFLEVCQ
ncbi:hypothetical protein V9T40_011242 [Parthenolecanium corni]|uniref:Uncharacterized protein n=1 Tax=Parthenolecanium corni TaxID=536013 RepID=A0AAN9TJM3_9HEMI